MVSTRWTIFNFYPSGAGTRLGCFQHHMHAIYVQWCICIQPRHQYMGCFQRITSMQSMFSGASAFNQDLSAWIVYSVNSMPVIFQSVSAINHDLSAW
eukprot:scaffold189881_cov41-Attheya_sp.AAC.1